MADVSRWTIRELLDAVMQDFHASELELEVDEESADSAKIEERETGRDESEHDGGEAS